MTMFLFLFVSIVVFFFKQKTAYEMRISDWSSDVCSSDLRAILQLLKKGEYITFTPDGPRGPRMRAGTGIVAAARLAGVPVMPATYSVRRRRLARSWDRFLIAWPFNRGVIQIGRASCRERVCQYV